MKKVVIKDSKYISQIGKIIEIQQMTEMEKYFKMR